MTDGDGYPEAAAALTGVATPGAAEFRALGRARRTEAERAVALLDPAARLRFLGFPDGGLDALWRGGAPYTSPYTGAGPFTHADVARAVEALLADVRPNVVVAPDPDDRHPDHAALGRFVAQAIAARAMRPLVLGYVIHADTWPPAPDAGRPMPVPTDPPFPTRRWTALALTPAEVETKQRAVAVYASQAPVLGGLLVRFVRASEPFAIEAR